MIKKKLGKGGLRLERKKSEFLKHNAEIISIFLFALFIILALSIFSYNPSDSSWFYISTSPKPISNWCGPFGANFSATLFYFLGAVSYFFVLAIPFFAYFLFRHKSFDKNWSRISSFFLLLVSVAAIFNSYGLDFRGGYPGGLIGGSLFRVISYPLGLVGGKVFFFALILISLISVFRISVVQLASKLFCVVIGQIKVFLVLLSKAALFVTKSTITFLAASFQKLFFRFKSLFKRKAKEELQEKQEAFFFWDDVKKGIKEDKTYSTAKLSEKNWTEVDRFKEKEIFVDLHSKKIGTFDLLFLPNSIFEKNILGTIFIEKLAQFKLEIAEKESSNFDMALRLDYNLPDIEIFERSKALDQEAKKVMESQAVERAKKLEEKLSYFGVKGKVTAIRPGPVITLFEYSPEVDSKISKIVALEDDLALALTALSIRIVAPIPGRSVVGFEISNKTRQKVCLSELLASEKFENFSGKLPVTFGVDIVGNPVVQDLVGMPHLLVAGSTGSGKSVGMNTMLVSLLCKFRPDELKLILIDPKRLEFAPYKDIPHLIFPIVTNPRQAAPVLKWLVQEMEKRYDRMAQVGVRNISEYHQAMKNNKELEEMPFIVLMIDELADLMMVAGKDVEMQIARIAQMARAAGIHMIVATQRPSVDVVTGLIKVNFPSRVAFRVSSKIDSRTIVDCQGAEKLLGRGDMLYMNSASSDLQRVHGAYVSVKEVEKLTNFLRKQAESEYLDLNETVEKMSRSELEEIKDEIYPQVVDFLKEIDEISISGLQRKYRIGFNRSAKIIERLEIDGLIAPAQGSKPRKVLKGNL